MSFNKHSDAVCRAASSRLNSKQNLKRASGPGALTALSLAVALALVPPAAFAYDADNPLIEATLDGSVIHSGDIVSNYEKIFAHGAEVTASVFNVSESEAEAMIAQYSENNVLPAGVNITVNGTVDLQCPGGCSSEYRTVIAATGRAIFNGGIAEGITTAITAQQSNLDVAGQDIVVNGNINAVDSDITIGVGGYGKAQILNHSVTVNGDIRNSASASDTKSYVIIGAVDRVIVNGSITNSRELQIIQYPLEKQSSDGNSGYEEAQADGSVSIIGHTENSGQLIIDGVSGVTVKGDTDNEGTETISSTGPISLTGDIENANSLIVQTSGAVDVTGHITNSGEMSIVSSEQGLTVVGDIANESGVAELVGAGPVSLTGNILNEDLFVISSNKATTSVDGNIENHGGDVIVVASSSLDISGDVSSVGGLEIVSRDSSVTVEGDLFNGGRALVLSKNAISLVGNVLNLGGLEVVSSESDVTVDGNIQNFGDYANINAAGTLTVNGNIEKEGSIMYATGVSGVTVNGDIFSSQSATFVLSPGAIAVNGNIFQRGLSTSDYYRTVQYFRAQGFDQEAAYGKAVAYIKDAGLPVPDYSNVNYDNVGDTKSASVLEIGSAEEDGVMLPSASVKINGNISVENSSDTANSIRIALIGNGSDWSWKGSASMTGAGCTNCALNEKGIYIDAYEGAVWQVEGAENSSYTNYGKVSSISRWTSYGPTVIDLTKTQDQVLLKIDELAGSGTVIKEKVDPNHVSGENLTDMVVLGGRSTGEHRVELYSTGAEPMEITTGRIPYLQVTVPCPVSQKASLRDDKLLSESSIVRPQSLDDGIIMLDESGEVVTIEKSQSAATMSLTAYNEEIASALKLSTEDSSAGSGKVAHIQLDGRRIYSYSLNHNDGSGMSTEFDIAEEFPELTINYGNVNNEIDVGVRKYRILDPVVQPDGTVMFYLEMEGHLQEDGTPAPASQLTFNELSTGAEIVTTLAGDGAMYSAWMADLSDLRKRLGEVRYGAQDGLWAKGIAQKDRIEGMTGADFKQKLYGLQFGLDHIVTQDEDRMWLLGGNFKYNTVDQKVDAMRYGHGDMKSYGAFLYATYADYKGYYTDLVLSLDHYKQKMTAEQTDSSYVHGKYNTWGWGASVEVGKMFSSTQNDEGWGPWYNNWWIEPQAQLAYYWINGKKFSMDNDMNVRQKNGDSLIGRLGVVIGKKFNYGANRKEVDKRYSQFYVKGGVKHEFLGKQTLHVNNDTFNDKLRGTRVYYGAGMDWNFTDQMKLYAQVERESGHKYKKDYEVSVGLKWQF
jgi:outer membrane autotransporter protein